MIDLSCHQKFEKNSPTGSGNIGARSSWKYGKSHGRLDPTIWPLWKAAVLDPNSILTACEPICGHKIIILKLFNNETTD